VSVRNDIIRGMDRGEVTALVLLDLSAAFDTVAFSVAGPHAWKSLPINVHSAQSMYSFRKLVKTFLFQRAYSELDSCFNIVRRPCSIYCVSRIKFIIFTLHYITVRCSMFFIVDLRWKIFFICYGSTPVLQTGRNFFSSMAFSRS